MVVGLLISLYAALSPAVRARRERTLVIVKPDGVQRGLIGQVVSRFEKQGFKLVAMKFLKASEEIIEMHCAAGTSASPINDTLYMEGNPVVAMVLEGKDVIKRVRDTIGATSHLKGVSGTIRGDYAVSDTKNIMHGSDSPASAKKEIDLWFKRGEIIQWDACLDDWISLANC